MAADLEGGLVEFRPAALLDLLAATAKTGMLRVTARHRMLTLWVADGVAVAAESAGADGPLVDDGLLDQLVDLLRTPSGAFRFTEGALARPDRVATPDPDLLPRAIERLHDWEALADAVPSLSLLVKLRNNTAPGPSEVTLSSAAWAVSVAVSSGQASVAAVAKHLHWSAFETCQAVRELVDAGRAVLAPPPKRRRGRRAGAAVSGPGVWHPANQPLWPGAGGDERDRFSAAWAFDE